MHVVKIDLKNSKVVVRPDSPTDLYVLSNIISPNDQVIAKSSRRVRRAGSEGRSGDESQRITMVIGIQAEDWAFQDSTISNRLRVKGKIFQGPEQHVAIGSYHTLNLEISQTITILKSEWTQYYLQLLKEAEEASKKPKICLIAIDTTDACVAILDNYAVQIVAQEKSHISRKQSKEKTRSNQINQFFETISGILRRKIVLETPNIIIGGPGFIKERFALFLKDKFVKEELNIVVAGSLSGGNRVGISELLKSETIDKIAADFRIFAERRIIDEFLVRLNQGSKSISYGFSAINRIAETGAVESLILNDSLLHGNEGVNSELIQELLKKIDRNRGRIIIISTNSENGQQVKTFGGLIALLRYSIDWN
ncbi:mRNA surveillance protein pelota [Candidatus Hodarchaeum mangrovi]